MLLSIIVTQGALAKNSGRHYTHNVSSHKYHGSKYNHIKISDVKVRGYYRKNGTYVSSYHRTRPNKSKYDNYSTKGNYNPYTGKKGYKKPY